VKQSGGVEREETAQHGAEASKAKPLHLAVCPGVGQILAWFSHRWQVP